MLASLLVYPYQRTILAVSLAQLQFWETTLPNQTVRGHAETLNSKFEQPLATYELWIWALLRQPFIRCMRTQAERVYLPRALTLALWTMR